MLSDSVQYLSSGHPNCSTQTSLALRKMPFMFWISLAVRDFHHYLLEGLILQNTKCWALPKNCSLSRPFKIFKFAFLNVYESSLGGTAIDLALAARKEKPPANQRIFTQQYFPLMKEFFAEFLFTIDHQYSDLYLYIKWMVLLIWYSSYAVLIQYRCILEFFPRRTLMNNLVKK